MRTIVNRALVVLLVVSITAAFLLWKYAAKITDERDRYQQNTDALLADMKRVRIDSTRMTVETKTLRLTVSEYEKYRAEDAALIKRLGIRVKDLEAAARHQLAVQAPIMASVRDSIVVRDTVLVPVGSVAMKNPFIDFRGIIEDSVLTASVHIPVTLNQAVFVEYKHRFLWWRWKVRAVQQTITSDNPYVGVEYSEYIRISK